MKDFDKHLINCNSSIKDALIKINELGNSSLALIVIDNEGHVIGSIADGDIRRKLIVNCSLESSVEYAMMRQFKYVFSGNLNVELIKSFRESGFEILPIIDRSMHLVELIDFKYKKNILPIDAVLMAGGKGIRLRPLTEKTPKPLLKIGGKSIIDYNVEHLILYGIDNISVTVNYLKEQVENHFSKEINGLHVNCVRESAFLGTIGAAKLVKIFKNDTILIMNSDLFTNIEYENFYLHFIQHDADMSVAVFPYSISVQYGIFNLNGRYITSVAEKPTYNYYANAGIYLIKKAILDEIPNDTYFDATDLIEKLINEKKKVIRFPITGYWIDIGKPEDYSKAQEIVKHL